MEEIKDSGYAFPQIQYDYLEAIYDQHNGMTLRDYFAGQAITAIADVYQMRTEVLAHRAYEIADAMLKEKEK